MWYTSRVSSDCSSLSLFRQLMSFLGRFIYFVPPHQVSHVARLIYRFGMQARLEMKKFSLEVRRQPKSHAFPDGHLLDTR